jgi:hypothetical protein
MSSASVGCAWLNLSAAVGSALLPAATDADTWKVFLRQPWQRGCLNPRVHAECSCNLPRRVRPEESRPAADEDLVGERPVQAPGRERGHGAHQHVFEEARPHHRVAVDRDGRRRRHRCPGRGRRSGEDASQSSAALMISPASQSCMSAPPVPAPPQGYAPPHGARRAAHGYTTPAFREVEPRPPSATQPTIRGRCPEAVSGHADALHVGSGTAAPA